MPRKIDLKGLTARASYEVDRALSRHEKACKTSSDYLLDRWVAKMIAVEVDATWERYAEERLISALNHEPK